MKTRGNNPTPAAPPAPPLEYAQKVQRPRPGWVRLPLEHGVLAGYLPNQCCQCMAEGNTRVVTPLNFSADVSVYLCPACRARWRRRTRQVALSVAAGMAIAVISASALIVSRTPRAMGWLELVAMVAGLTGAAVFLSIPILHCFATPMLVGWAGRRAEAVWIRFPNEEYVKKIGPASPH
jgi:hypothetical protein